MFVCDNMTFTPDKEIEKRILQIVADDGFGVNISKISLEANCLRTTARNHLVRLTKEGKLTERIIGKSRVFAPAETLPREQRNAAGTPA